MKHLKTFEKLLKYNDPAVINHPLLDLIKEIENILIKLRKLDSTEKTTIIRKYFNSTGDINIVYKYVFHTLFMIKLKINNDNNSVRMIVSHGSTLDKNDPGAPFTKHPIEFFHFIKIELEKYISGRLNLYKSIEEYIFTLKEINNVIQKLEKFSKHLDMKMDANKYNL